jgi:hypothetical protein
VSNVGHPTERLQRGSQSGGSRGWRAMNRGFPFSFYQSNRYAGQCESARCVV